MTAHTCGWCHRMAGVSISSKFDAAIFDAAPRHQFETFRPGDRVFTPMRFEVANDDVNAAMPEPVCLFQHPVRLKDSSLLFPDGSRIAPVGVDIMRNYPTRQVGSMVSR